MPKIEKRCIFCGGIMSSERISQIYRNFGSKKILLENIPGDKCQKCGIEVIHLKIIEKIRVLLGRIKKGEEKGVIEQIIVKDFSKSF